MALFTQPAPPPASASCASTAAGPEDPEDEDAPLARIFKTSSKSWSLSCLAFFRRRALRFSAFLNSEARRFLSAFMSRCCFLSRPMVSRSSLPVPEVVVSSGFSCVLGVSAALPGDGPPLRAASAQGERPRPSPSQSSPKRSSSRRGLAMAPRRGRCPGNRVLEPRSYGVGLSRAPEGPEPPPVSSPRESRWRWAHSRGHERRAGRP